MRSEQLRRAAARLGLPGWGALFAVFGAQFVPLTHLLGYEFATLCGLLCIWLGVPWLIARRQAWWQPERAWASWLCAMRPLALAVVVAGLVGAANALRVQNCDLASGALIYLWLALGAVPTAAALALVSVAARPGRGAYLVALAVVLVSYGGTLQFLATQPAITAYNSFFGYFAGSIYDEALQPVSIHAWFRGYTVAAAAAAVGLVVLRAPHRAQDRALFGLAAVAAATLFAYRGELGLERNRAYVERALGGRMETAHFEIYFDAGALDETERRLLASDHEARFAEVRQLLGVQAPARKLRSFVYANREQKGALMGARNTLFAKVWLGEMQLLWSGLGDSMLVHELTHLMLAESAGNWMGLPTRFGVPLNGVLEGAANAVEWAAEERDDHAWAAAIVRLGKGVPVAELMSPVGFWRRQGDTVYTLSGSFIRWLIETKGAPKFLAVYRSGDPRAVYGRDWSELEASWRTFLAAYPLTEDELDAASFRFDRQSVFEKRCARTIASRFEEVSSHLARGADGAATKCLEQILTDDPSNLLYKMRVAGLLRRAGGEARAEVLAVEVASDARATRSQRGEAARVAGDMAWSRGDLAGATIRFREALSLTPASGGRRALGVRLQAIAEAEERPRAAEAIRRYLGAEGPALAVSTAELAEAVAAEQSQVARYLLAVRLLQLGPSATTERLAAEALALEEEPMRAAFLLRSQGRYWARKGAAKEACEVWSRVLSEAAPGSEAAVEARMWLGRCEAGTLPNLDVPSTEWE